MWAEPMAVGLCHQSCLIYAAIDDKRKKKKTSKMVDSNKLEGKTTTINGRADSHNEVCKLSLKADFKKKEFDGKKR